MKAMILLFLLGLAGGIYWKGLRAKVEAARSKTAFDRQIGVLQQELASMHDAESRRTEELARRKRYREENDVTDIVNQIRFISKTELRAVRPVNKEAVRVLYALDEWIATYRPGWRVSFEVSMGAFIKTAYDLEDRVQKSAFSSYNSKRVDFLLIDRFGQPMLVIEYHGTGHDLSDDAFDRMEVKRLVLSRAAIPLVEVPAKTPKSDILCMIARKLASSATTGAEEGMS